MPGVRETVVGYCGGADADPTYQSMGDHTESIRVTIDPREISLEEIYKLFFTMHQPMPIAFTSRQYRSAIFFADEAQRGAAEAVAASLSQSNSLVKHTAIERAGPFYRAEEYHQKFLSKAKGRIAI